MAISCPRSGRPRRRHCAGRSQAPLAAPAERMLAELQVTTAKPAGASAARGYRRFDVEYKSAPAAAARCMRSARRSARCSTSCRHACGCCASAGRTTAAAPAGRSIRHPRRSVRSPRAWRALPCWPTCWSANTAITRRSIASPRSSPGTASRSTVRPWQTGSAALAGGWSRCRRAWPRMCSDRSKLFADDTPIPVLDPGRGRTKTGRLWVYTRDDRPWGGPDPPAAVYFYSPDRKAERPASHLESFSGILQVDGYVGFERLTDARQHRAGSLLGAHAEQVLRGA